MNASELNQLNELAGRIEGVGRVLLHLVAKLEDSGLIDGQDFVRGLRGSIVLGATPHPLMPSAKTAMERAADALDEARRWRRFRRQVGARSNKPSL